MDLSSFIKQEKNSADDSVQDLDDLDKEEKKIEFAQKLPPEDIEGKMARKGGDFNFASAPEPRKEGDKAPVKIKTESPAMPAEKKRQEPNWLFRLWQRMRGGEQGSFVGQVPEVNLVRGEIIKYFDWQKGILALMIAIFLSLTVLSLTYWGISWWAVNKQNAQSNTHLQEYYRIDKEIKTLEPRVEEVVKFKNKLEVMNFLLARHIYWTNFFTFLEKNTLSDVFFSNFNGNLSGGYALSATADSLNAIDGQVKKFLSNPEITSASVGAGSISGESVNFSISFSIDPKIFLK
ncbi:MAG TPA: hypothetical protein VMD74_04410 [Candidatus Methylomirabilis sp.]|nr:hypothetical protein [Candidatus Methylomirabilis sp.]